jgi:hypothetical protein
MFRYVVITVGVYHPSTRKAKPDGTSMAAEIAASPAVAFDRPRVAWYNGPTIEHKALGESGRPG